VIEIGDLTLGFGKGTKGPAPFQGAVAQSIGYGPIHTQAESEASFGGWLSFSLFEGLILR
jgi:hypothetical protein